MHNNNLLLYGLSKKPILVPMHSYLVSAMTGRSGAHLQSWIDTQA